MKTFRRIALAAAILAPVSAYAGTEITVSGIDGDVTASIPALSFSEKTGVSGAEIRVRGDHGGLRYDVSAAKIDTDYGDAGYFDAKLGWMFSGIVGPSVRYVHTDSDGSGMTFVGISGEYDLKGVALYADLMSDVDSFGDRNLYKVGADLNDYRFRPYVEHTRYDVSEGVETRQTELGVRFGVTEKVDVFSAWNRADSELNNVQMKAETVKAGLSFRF